VTQPESALLVAALSYSERGWPVFPCWWVRGRGLCACGRQECSHPGKHPLGLAAPGGCTNATTDGKRVESWWTSWPLANVAIATGLESHLVVLDIDPRNGGDDSYSALEARHGRLPDTARSLTGGGGFHEYYAHPGDRQLPCRRNLGGIPGIDLKADGGYVIAPPSTHGSGRTYAWDATAHPDDLVLAVLPRLLTELVESTPSVHAEPYQTETWDGRMPERAERLISRNRRLKRRFERDAEGLSDRSPSGVDASLATLFALSALSAREIEAAIRASRAIARLPSRPPSYYGATVGKALAIARARAAEQERFADLVLGGLRNA